MDLREMIAHQWARYERLNDREQLLIFATLILLLFTFFVFFIWEPLHSAQDASQKRYYDELELQQELQALQPRAGTTPKGQIDSSDQSLLAVVNKSTAESGINLKRVEPKNDQSLRVWVDDIEFNKLISWIASLEANHNVKVETISVDRTENAGFINTALVLNR